MLGARRFRRRRTKKRVDSVAVAPIVDARVALLVRRRATDVGDVGGESFASAASQSRRPVRRVRPALEAARLSRGGAEAGRRFFPSRRNDSRDTRDSRDSRLGARRDESNESNARRVRLVGGRRGRRDRRGVGGDARTGVVVTGAVRKHDSVCSGSPRFDPARRRRVARARLRRVRRRARQSLRRFTRRTGGVPRGVARRRLTVHDERSQTDQR